MKRTILTAWAALILNTLQAIIKCFVGIIAHSNALFADGLHGISDVLMDIIVLGAAIYAAKPADNNYPYGRGRYESLGILIVSISLIFAAMDLLGTVILEPSLHIMQHSWVLIVAFISAVSSMIAFFWMRHYAVEEKNDFIQSNAIHQLIDGLSSLVVFFSSIADMYGYTQSDTVATIIVVLLIVYSMVPFLRTSLLELTDHATDATYQTNLRECILAVPGIDEIHHLRTRRSASRVILDAHITLNHHLSFTESHWIAERLTTYLIHQDPIITNVLIHADPDVDISTQLSTRDVYQQKWQACGIPLELLQTQFLVLHYLENEIHADWKMMQQYTVEQYTAWIKDITRVTPDITYIALWQNIVDHHKA